MRVALLKQVLLLIGLSLNGLMLADEINSSLESKRDTMDQLDINRHRAIKNEQKSNKRTVVAGNGINGDYNLQRDYVATTVGKEVQLDCKMKDLLNDDDKIVWLKMPKGEVLALNGNRVTADPRITTKCVNNLTPCWSLVITNTRESDSGFFVCQTNAMQTKYVYLDIMVPPKLLTQYPVDRIDVNQTMNASITCEFYGKPEPLIKWFKYHSGIAKEIEKLRGMKTIHLYIHKDSPSEFECVADNSIPPTVSKKIYLNIQFAPQIKFQNTKVFQKVGERVIFDCNVNSNPKAKIYWYKNQIRIHESSKYILENLDNSYHRLYINNLTESDFSDYYCTAVNLLGKAQSKIELLELPSINTPQMVMKTSKLATTNTPSTVSIVFTNPTSSAKPPNNSTRLLDLINETVRFHNPYLNKNIWSSFQTNINDADYYNVNKKNELYDTNSNSESSNLEDNSSHYNYVTTTKHKNGKLPSYRSNKFSHHNNHTKLNKKDQQRKLHHKQQSYQNYELPTTTFMISPLENKAMIRSVYVSKHISIAFVLILSYLFYSE